MDYIERNLAQRVNPVLYDCFWIPISSEHTKRFPVWIYLFHMFKHDYQVHEAIFC